MRVKQLTMLLVIVAGTAALALIQGCGGGQAEAEVSARAEDQVCDHDHDPHTDEDAHADEDTHADEGAHSEEDHGAAEASAAAPSYEEGHEDHGHESGSPLVRLSERELEECGVSMALAGPGWLDREIVIPGEVRINGDLLAHMVPRVPGIVTEVLKTLGDAVERGDVLAVIESNDLADVRVDYLAARERLTLAESNFEREKNLWEKEITSEQEYLDARSELTEARIESRSSEQKLYALGLTLSQVGRLSADDDEAFTRYEVRAPFDGTVVDKHITLGEKVGDDSEIFVVADLSTVWVDLSITQKDLPFVRTGTEVTISAGYGVPDAEGIIDYVSPVVGENTRTATARIVLANPDGLWRPGLFVSARLSVAGTEVPVLIPRTAAQNLDEEWVVFVEVGDGFEPVPVSLGRGDENRVEVLAGLTPGRRYVAEGAFECKAKVVTENIDPHAGHGH